MSCSYQKVQFLINLAILAIFQSKNPDFQPFCGIIFPFKAIESLSKRFFLKPWYESGFDLKGARGRLERRGSSVLLVPLVSLTVLTAPTRSALLPTTSLMPGASTMARCTVSAPMASTGLVLSALVPAHTTCSSIAPMSTQPASITVTSASPYAASLLPKQYMG